MENTQNQSQDSNNVIQASLVAGNGEGKVPKESRLSKITDVKDFVIQYLSDSTRHTFTHNDIEIKNLESFICELFVCFHHSLVIEHKEHISKKSNKNILSRREYQYKIQETKNDGVKSYAYLNLLYDRIQSSKYGKVERFLCELPESFSYQDSCKKCAGRGILTCPKCDGNCWNKCDAWDCKDGRVKKTNYNNGKTKTSYVDCNRCQGRGKIKCRKCDGNGNIKCSECNNGLITITATFTCHINSTCTIKMAEGEYAFDPREIIQSLQQESLDEYGETSRNSIQQEPTSVVEHYHIKIPFASCQILYHSKPFVWKLYGTNTQVASNDEMFAYILDEDLQSLKSIAKNPYREVIFADKLHKTLKTFTSSPINAKILETINPLYILDMIRSPQNHQSEENIENLKTACSKLGVTKGYLLDTFSALYIITQSYCRISRFLWFILSLIVLCLITFRYFTESDFDLLDYLILDTSIIMLICICGWVYRSMVIRIFYGKAFLQWVNRAKINKLYFWIHFILGLLAGYGSYIWLVPTVN